MAFQRHGFNELDEGFVGVRSGPGQDKGRANGSSRGGEHDVERLGDVENVSGSCSSLTAVQVEQSRVC